MVGLQQGMMGMSEDLCSELAGAARLTLENEGEVVMQVVSNTRHHSMRKT